MELSELPTETRNPRTLGFDAMPTEQLLQVMNDEDASVAGAVATALPRIAQAVELVVRALSGGGRLVYVGAGTSGRLGLLDAAECPPTFGTDPAQVVGLMAGGQDALHSAVEGAEDDGNQGGDDLARLGLGPADVVVGLSASGRTPYVLGALAQAHTLGCATVAVACNPQSAVGTVADVAVEVVTGPEVLTGSTRLKAGTAQKLVCNMITTVSMVRLGKVYDNLMVDMLPTNRKLDDRATRIVIDATGCTPDEAREAMVRAEGQAKVAIVLLLGGGSPAQARARLSDSGGRVREAIG